MGAKLSVRKADNFKTSWDIITLSGNLLFVENSWHFGPVMARIYLSNPLRCRSPAFRLL